MFKQILFATAGAFALSSVYTLVNAETATMLTDELFFGKDESLNEAITDFKPQEQAAISKYIDYKKCDNINRTARLRLHPSRYM